MDHCEFSIRDIAKNSENNTSTDELIPHGAIQSELFIGKASCEDIFTANYIDNVLIRIFLHRLHQDEQDYEASSRLAKLPSDKFVKATLHERLQINALENDIILLLADLSSKL